MEPISDLVVACARLPNVGRCALSYFLTPQASSGPTRGFFMGGMAGVLDPSVRVLQLEI